MALVGPCLDKGGRAADQCIESTKERQEALVDQFHKLKAAIPAEVDEAIDRLLMPGQLKAVGKGFLIWLVPVVLVYLIGLAVAWVGRGFKP
jgi:hypothetical protein